MPEIRQDPVTGRCVIIAPNRAKRPRHYDVGASVPRLLECPFCQGNEAMTPPEIDVQRESDEAGNSGWRVRVVPNKYPALENSLEWTTRKQGVYTRFTGFGSHEVIIESPSHVTNIGALSQNQLTDVLRIYRRRLRALRDEQRWSCLMIYKNQGEGAGATLDHIHSQLLAFPMVPHEVGEELNGAVRHYQSSNCCIYCSMVSSESERGERMVHSTERFVALCPFAPRFAYETWILPKTHVPIFEDSSDEELCDLSRVLWQTMAKLNRALNDPPFNYVIHSLPLRQTARLQYHWHVEILPQLSKAAGLEWGSGIHLNPVSPEDAARLLRTTVI